MNRCADSELSYEIRAEACGAFVDQEPSKEGKSAAFAVWAFAEIDFDNPGLAIARADTALKLFPHNYLAMAARGWGYMAVADYDRARSDFYQAGRYDSPNARMQSNLGLSAMAWEFESFALTRQLATDVLKTDPKHPNALYLRASAAVAMQEFDDAFADAEALISAYPDYPVGFELKGFAFLERATHGGASIDYSSALQEFERALAVGDEPSARLLRRYAWLLVTGPTEVRNPAKGLDLMQRAMAEAERTVIVPKQMALFHHGMAVALAENGRIRDAEIELDVVLEKFPSARSRVQKALAGAGYLKQSPSATLYELIGAIHACFEASCDALSVPLIYKTF